ncbi:MAG: YdcF family protein, partial [Dechloromonas sp.]
AVVARRYGLPVLVSGGQPRNASRSEADVIADLLEKEFGVPVRWREGNSLDTADNARFSAVMLHGQGIRKIVLVTQAFHMPRARRLFEAAGFEVIPAPTELASRQEQPRSVLDWLPRTRAMQDSYYALHEWLGLLWTELTLLRRQG